MGTKTVQHNGQTEVLTKDTIYTNGFYDGEIERYFSDFWFLDAKVATKFINDYFNIYRDHELKRLKQIEIANAPYGPDVNELAMDDQILDNINEREMHMRFFELRFVDIVDNYDEQVNDLYIVKPKFIINSDDYQLQQYLKSCKDDLELND